MDNKKNFYYNTIIGKYLYVSIAYINGNLKSRGYINDLYNGISICEYK